MFKVFDRKKKQIDLLENPISPVITNELGGIGELTFSVPSTYKHLELEGYIQVENDHEYVIKEIVTHGTNRDVVCMLNIEEILGMAWSKFISRDNTLMKCAELVLNGTGWRAVDNSSCNVKRNLYGTVTNSYNLLQMMCTVYNVEFIFDTYNKVVTFVDKVGRDAGVYFMKDINLKQLNVDTHTHKYITRVIPVGKNGLTIESVNNGKNYLENKTYTTKNIYGIWQSDKHDNPQALMDDARRFLDEMAIPYETYEVVVDDLYALKGYEEFEYGLGDIVTIIDGDTETRIQQRVIQRTYNLLEPDKDTIHIANKDATFEDYYKRLQTIADMTQSVIGSDGTISGGSISDGTVSGDKLENDSITSDHIQSGSITSTHIKAEQILADHIMSNQITTNHLVADSITSDHIQANAIDTKHLKADIITSDHIQSNTIKSNHISANTITSGHIQSGAITAGSGIIADGAIGNAQISNIDAGKIEAGTIDTSRVTIQGSNGHLRLKGNRMQVFQGTGNQAKERVSVGDVNGDGTVYGLRVRGADGQTILLDENGVTSEGITDGSITNDKISEDANIDGAKLNINSVINRINTDGTEVIQGTKIEVDGTNLGVKLSEITNKQTSDGERITQAQAQITANQNAIKLKVDEQVYTSDKQDMTSKLEKNTSEISTMKGQIALKVEQVDIENAKSELEGTMDSKIDSAKADIKITTDAISQNVSNLSQTVSNKADGSTVSSLNSKVSSLETSVNGISGKVTSLEKTTTTLGTQVDTANTNASSALNKANSATTTANNAQNTANTNKNNITNLQGEVNTVKNNVASLEVTTSGISQKVSSVESTTATLSGKVNTAQSTADAAKSAAANAQNSANNANNALSINQQTKMNGIELFNNEYKSNTSARPFTNGNYSVVVATEISGANANESNIIKVTNGQILYTDFIACNINNPYYASIEVYNKDTNNGTNYIQVCYYDKNKTALASNEAALAAISGVTIPSANAWHKLEGWVNPPALTDVRRKAKYVRIRIINRYNGQTGITYWRNISWKQLGSGLLADTQETKTEIASTKSKVATIETNLSGITSRVSKVETNQTTVNGKVSSLETRMSTAESKITESAITNTVKKNFYTKSETDSQITSKGYQTASQVQQTVNGLEVKVSQSGGYNLLRNTSFLNGSTYWSTGDGRVVDTSRKNGVNNSMKIVSTGATSAVWRGITQRFAENIPTGKTYRATLYYYVADKSTFNSGFTLELKGRKTGTTSDSGIASTSVSAANLVVGKWTKITVKCTTTQSWDYLFIYPWVHMNGTIWISNPIVTEGELELPWCPHPSEIYDGITTIDKDGITVSNSSSSTHTQIDSSSFRVENNTGGTIAEFSQNSQIPNLSAGIINANEIYASNIARKSTYVKNYYVAGGYGNDREGAGGSWSNPCKTVQYVLDNYIEDILDYDVNIYVGESVPGWTCKSKSGKGVISFKIENDCIVRDPLYLDNCTNRVVVNGYAEKKGTFMTGIVVTGCHNFDIGWVSFRGKNWAHNSGSCNVIIRDGSKGLVRFNDFNGCSFAIIVENNSELWVFGNRGSDITHYIGLSSYTTIYGMRSGTDTCPDFTGYYYADAGHSNLYHIHDGANYTKTPSIGWSPSYTPTQKTQTWSFNKIWSDETLHGWSDRQELIQGYASTWNTGRWTGYMQMTDGMAGIRSAISGGTNLSGRIYVQRTSSSGNSTGSKLCLYASDGTLITNSTSINRSQGVWVSLSSSIIQKIQSGAITYFYLKADANNNSTYFKCQSNAKIEITYTK